MIKPFQHSLFVMIWPEEVTAGYTGSLPDPRGSSLAHIADPQQRLMSGLIWLLQWLALHQTGSNCEIDVRRQTEVGGKAQAAWQQARLEGGSPEHADLLLPLIIGRLFLCLPVGVFKKKPQCHCASCQESTYLGFNGAHVGTFFNLHSSSTGKIN